MIKVNDDFKTLTTTINITNWQKIVYFQLKLTRWAAVEELFFSTRSFNPPKRLSQEIWYDLEKVSSDCHFRRKSSANTWHTCDTWSQRSRLQTWDLKGRRLSLEISLLLATTGKQSFKQKCFNQWFLTKEWMTHSHWFTSNDIMKRLLIQ